MQKWNLKHVSVYVAVIVIISIYSFVSSVVPVSPEIVQAYQKILFVVPVLFIIAAFLAFRIAETGIVLIALSFLLLSLSHPIINLFGVLNNQDTGIDVLNSLLSNGVLLRFSRILTLILPLSLSLIFLIPDKVGRISITFFKIILAFFPFVFLFFPDYFESHLVNDIHYGRIMLPRLSLAASVLPLAAPWLYRNRRSGTFSAALTSALILSMLPLILALEGFLIETCYMFAGVILLHSLYRVYWENSYIDELTGLFNRRALDERMRRLRNGYSLAMVDVDHFKNFNDSYGHDEGDNVLRLVAKILYLHFGKFAYRYGGEEFCVVFMKTDADTAADEMDEARTAIEDHMFSIRQDLKNRKKSSRKKPVRGVKKVKLTVSAGIAPAGKFRGDASAVLRSADKALYKAKEGGRNRVEIVGK